MTIGGVRYHRAMIISCPLCRAELGAWKLRLVHLIMGGIWKYRCDCGWESPSGRSQNSLRNLYFNLFWKKQTTPEKER